MSAKYKICLFFKLLTLLFLFLGCLMTVGKSLNGGCGEILIPQISSQLKFLYIAGSWLKFSICVG